jgi:hypothetical protein
MAQEDADLSYLYSVSIKTDYNIDIYVEYSSPSLTERTYFYILWISDKKCIGKFPIDYPLIDAIENPSNYDDLSPETPYNNFFLVNSPEKNDKIAKIEIMKAASYYYVYNNIAYDIHFPLLWVFTHRENIIYSSKIGPNYCKVCQEKGYFQSVFIGYCSTCAIIGFNRRRGNGFYDYATEYITENGNSTGAFQTYLKTACLREIGSGETSLGIEQILEN